MANFKHVLFKQYKNNSVSYNMYNQYKNNLNRIIKKYKKSYYANKFISCRNNVKKTWKIINNILSKPRKNANNISLINNNGEEIHNEKDVANQFCEHFTTVAVKLDSKIPITNTDPMMYMPAPNPISFNLIPTTSDEVNQLINSLPDKPCHVNNIPIFIL